MSSVKCLQEKLSNHLEKIEPEARRLQTERTAFNRKVMDLFEHLEEILGSVKGLALTICPTGSFGSTKSGRMEILILDKKVELQPNEIDGEFILKISGLFDRALDFSLQGDGSLITSDQASASTVILDDELIFRGLCALIPE